MFFLAAKEAKFKTVCGFIINLTSMIVPFKIKSSMVGINKCVIWRRNFGIFHTVRWDIKSVVGCGFEVILVNSYLFGRRAYFIVVYCIIKLFLVTSSLPYSSIMLYSFFLFYKTCITNATGCSGRLSTYVLNPFMPNVA